MMSRRPKQIIVRTRNRVHVCSVDAACRSCQSNCNDNTHTLGNPVSQKEEVATNNEEPQARYIHWAKNLRKCTMTQMRATSTYEQA